MDYLIFLFGLLLALIGILGAIIPIIPGPITSWLSLLLLKLYAPELISNFILGVTLSIGIAISILDYIIPSLGTKKFGGTKYGVWGTTIGLFIGIFFSPLGIIIGPLLGAFIGEMLYDYKNKERAFKVAIGSFAGFLASTGLKLICSLFYCWIFISKAIGLL